MAKKGFFFSYKLRRRRKTVRIGKGQVHTKGPDAVVRYLKTRYGKRRWDGWSADMHSSESAALKAEERKIDAHELRTGAKPRWNVRKGGGGRTATVLCRALRSDGRKCRNRALVGLYGYCGVHRPRPA
jgi:hypothetical protein